uniref:Crossover junction endonuclease MUS81 n=1 Tax=Echeneis naucrates TaxID=173247 RepID=A0A665VS31_ECHNA
MPASKPVRLGRKRVLPACPNPLFLQWLTELRDEAREKGLKIQYVYQKAINSLNKYPLPLQNAKEAKILQNFGDGICKILDEKLQQHLRQNGPQAPTHSLSVGGPPPGRPDNNSLASYRKKNAEGDGGRRKKREYVPQKRSGGYAVLLTLYRQSQIPGSKGYMFKLELQDEAQLLCDKSFTVPDLGSKYTAWSSVSTLIQKNLVIKTHNPARYSLTEEGLHLAERLESAETPEGGRLEVRREEEDGPGVVDLTETFLHHRKQELVKELQRNGVNFDVRKLNVGDFLWVAREKVAPIPGQLRAPTGRELALDYIIERKRIDDLCGSIIDGRFREQKFRLKRCGLRRPIYLVEECGTAASHLSLPEATLKQAIINTQVVDGFFVKRVQDVRESAAYLTVMTRYLTKLYQNRTLSCRSRELEGDEAADEEEGGILPSCSLLSFAEFNYGAVKNKSQTVREVFARQLMQISGLSGDKAAAILEQYNTPHSLLSAYERCAGEAEKEKLLSSIRYGKLKRNLGPALSRTVYQLYCTKGALS